MDRLAILQGCFNKAAEKRMTIHRSRLELRVKLAAEKPRMIFELDDLDQFTVRRKTAQNHPFGAELGAVTIIELITVAMSFGNLFSPVQFGGEGLVLQHTRESAQAHGTALGVDRLLLRH